MKIKDIITALETGENQELALKSLKQKRLFKWLSLAIVSAIVTGLSLVYLVRAERTFSSQNQKILLVILSGLLLLASITCVTLLDKEKANLKTSHSRFKFADLFTFIAISVLIIFHVTTYYFVTAEVNQSSMHPTLNDSDRLIVFQFDYTPHRNDIAVIYMNEENYEGGDNTHYVKRVVGLPGDTITINGANDLIINGTVVQNVPNNYATALLEIITSMEEQIIPEGYYFVLGDNTANSHDSRTIGFIHEEDILAKVIFRFYPDFGGVK